MNIFKTLAGTADKMAGKLTRDKEVGTWLDEIAEAKKREQDYRKAAQKSVELFEVDKGDSVDTRMEYNILYANTETLAPAIYNSVPRPVVSRRFKDDNPLGLLSAKVMQRTLEFLMDSNTPDYSPFDELQKTAVAEALLPGRGCTRFRYEAPIEGEPGAEQVTYQTVCGEEVPWNRVYFGYAKRWSQIPWQCFEHFMTKEECIANFGEEVGGKISLTAVPKDSGEPETDLPADADGVKFGHIYEIWDKNKKEVIFISEGYGKPIRRVPDPLKLSGFFPQPRPMMFLRKVSSLIPQTLYMMYESQAAELNIITMRITAITKALKVRGFYDSTLSGLDNLMTKPDNTILPATNVAALQQGQSLENSIWLMPIEKLVAVLQQLYVNRQQVKQVIYEITGIADILRGSSSASETLGAQKMKEAWGTMRLKRMQKEVQRYARDSLRMMAELAGSNFSPETFAKMTGIQLPTPEEKQQAQMFLQQVQQQAQMQQQPPQPGMPPQPPPQQPDPAAMAKAQAVAEQFTWDDVVGMLRNDLIRNYVIDIETNSTIDAEATEDKEQVAEFMNAFSQLLNGFAPMVEKGFMPFDVAKTMMLAVVKRFRFGQEVEDQLKQMKAPPPPTGGDPKAEAEAQKMQAEMKAAGEMHQIKMAQAQGDGQLQQAKTAAGMAQMQQEQELAQMRFNLDKQLMLQEAQLAGIKLETAQVVAENTQAVSALKLETAKAPDATV